MKCLCSFSGSVLVKQKDSAEIVCSMFTLLSLYSSGISSFVLCFLGRLFESIG